jgi:hypothetical protein
MFFTRLRETCRWQEYETPTVLRSNTSSLTFGVPDEASGLPRVIPSPATCPRPCSVVRKGDVGRLARIRRRSSLCNCLWCKQQ